MTLLKNIIFVVIAAYAAILLTLYVSQRRMMYVPDRSRVTPALAGLARAQAQEISTHDGETLVAWFVEPQPGKPVILYFHGNAGQIAGRAARFARLTEDGSGLLAVSYRGYGGSGGAPSEIALVADALTAYDHLRAKGIDPARIILFGESLGTGVAIALAAERQIGALVLEAPFSSTVDVAADVYWMFPVRWLMHDQFRSDLRVTKVSAPLLVVHAAGDRVVPIRFGERLFALAREPKTFLRITSASHQPLDEPEVLARVRTWLATHVK